MSIDALRIYQNFLDVTAAALLARDAEPFLARVHLPHLVATETQLVEIADMATSRRHFFGLADALRSQGADSYVRLARAVAFTAPDRIAGRHVSMITARGVLVSPRFETEVEMERRGGVWGSVRTRHRARFRVWPDLLPRHEAWDGRRERGDGR
jgi:hypothetical protein